MADNCIGIMALGPGDHCTGVRISLVGAIEIDGFAHSPVVALPVGPELGISLPQLLIGREGVHHLHAFALHDMNWDGVQTNTSIKQEEEPPAGE
ncbi:MAG: hypothetical protein IT448_11730 [Phycisphaerales bacterium]|nr:hypothetical protein [Phycisphaerales bacterium]